MTIIGPDGRVFLFYRGAGHVPEDIARAAHRRFFPDAFPWEVQVRDSLGNRLFPGRSGGDDAAHDWERAAAVRVSLLPRHNW